MKMRISPFAARITFASAEPRDSIKKASAAGFGWRLRRGAMWPRRRSARLGLGVVLALPDGRKILHIRHSPRRPADFRRRRGPEFFLGWGRSHLWRAKSSRGGGIFRLSKRARLHFGDLDAVRTMPAL
jgi:hypothetical protein